MKRRIVLAVLIAFTLPGFDKPRAAESEGLLYSGEGAPNFLGRIFEEIKASEYEIRFQEGANALQSPNRANNLRFTYHRTGFEVARRAPVEATDNWRAGIFLTGIDQKNSFRADASANWLVKRTWQ